LEKKRTRLLALILVLAVACVSYGALSMNRSSGTYTIGGSAVVITISSDAGDVTSWGVYLDPTSDYPAAQLQNPQILSAAGSQGGVTSATDPAAGHDYRSKGAGGGAPTAGDWSTVDFVSNTVGTYTIDLYQPSGTTTQIATADIEVVPEPATVVLLGLGGLLLVRRRR
jgi:hypothetical protein